MTPAAGQLIAGRFRLEQLQHQGAQSRLWRATDQMAGGNQLALWQWDPLLIHTSGTPIKTQELQRLWRRWQQVLHPQVPRLGGTFTEGGYLWLVREWQPGRSYEQLQALRGQRQLVFGAGEVLLLLRQLLPLLVVLHTQKLVHGDLRPAQLLRRESDGVPVLLDFAPLTGPGGREPSRDLQALGLVALSLMAGESPQALRLPGEGWRWPAQLAAEPGFQTALARLVSSDPAERFSSAAVALAAFESLPMPASTGPVPRSPSAVLAEKLPPQPRWVSPQSPPPAPTSVRSQIAPPAPAPTGSQEESRDPSREELAEGGIWPVLIALVLSAVVGTALGWWWLSRGRATLPSTADASLELPSILPQAELDQRQLLLNRLRAMQVDRGWFLKLVDAAMLDRYPERGGLLPGNSAEDAPLRQAWNALAEEWLVRVEQLPAEIRRRLGDFRLRDWESRQQKLVAQGLSPKVLHQLVSGAAQALLQGVASRNKGLPPEPFRQLWFAAAEQSLANMRVEPITALARDTRVVSAQVPAGGARLFPIRVPAGHRLVLGVNGSPLMQMSVYGADGSVLEERGPLRVVSLAPLQRSTPQLLVTNDGVAPAPITLSLRADPPPEPVVPVAPVEPSPVPEAEPGDEPAPTEEADLEPPPPN